MGIARYYQTDRNPENAVLPGVPLGDIDDATWARLPQWARDDVDAWTVNGSKVYRKTHRALTDPEPPAEDVKPSEALQTEVPATEESPPDEPEQPPDETPPEDILSDEGGS